jgi:NADH-quinone oxidoreductase subunit N
MVLFGTLFGGGLFSILIRDNLILRKFAFLIILIGLILNFNLTDTSEYISLFESIVLIVGLGLVLHLRNGDIIQLLFILASSIALLESNTILSFVVIFEAVAIISFVLVSYIQNSTEAEGSIKMFIIGATATGIILLGITIFSIGGGDINSTEIMFSNSLQKIGLWIILIGVLYKLTVFPFYFWAVDTYSMINHSQASILSGLIKTVVAIATFMIFYDFLITINNYILFAIISILTMTLGNILALYQKNIARILSYSSIAHAGYMLIPFASIESSYSSNGILYLAIAYIFMQTSAFLILDHLRNRHQIKTLNDLKGFASKNKIISLIFTIQLFSLAGIPLLAGFLSKAVAFYSGVDANLWWLILIALLNSALSVGYYAWIIKHIYFDSFDKNLNKNIKNSDNFNLPIHKFIGQLILLIGTLYFGIFATDILEINLF